jgi:hypothetical protein
MGRQRTQTEMDRVPPFTIYYADEIKNWEWSETDDFPWNLEKLHVQGINWTDGPNSTAILTDEDIYVYEVSTAVFKGATERTVQQRLDADMDFVAFYAREITNSRFQFTWDKQRDDNRFYGARVSFEQMRGQILVASSTGDFRLIMEKIVEMGRQYNFATDIRTTDLENAIRESLNSGSIS